MPPKKTFSRDDSDDDDDSTTETSSSEGEVAPTRQNNNNNSSSNATSNANNNGRGIANKPHDEEFDAGHDEGVRTPPGDALRRPSGATTQATVTPAGKSGGTMLRNNPNDETFDVEDDDERVRTPPQRGNNVPPPAAGGQRGAANNSGKAGAIQNNPHDYYEDAGDEGMETPPRQNIQPVAGKKPSSLNTNALGNRQLQNDTHDEAIDVSDNSQGTPASTYGSATPQSGTKHSLAAANNLSSAAGGAGNRQTLPAPQGKMSMAPHRDDESSSEEEDDDAASNGGGGHQMGSNGGNGMPTSVPGLGTGPKTTSKPPPTQEYNPADYASINQRASREMQELFMTIAQYQPQVQELPSKLRPFIPDFIPSVGDLDPFCKVPRPDARPDNLGLTVVDEPSANQSNPAVVALLMKHVTRGSAPFVYVESVEDSSNRPNVIDKWIADIKDLHYKKPLPTVNYSKVMPEIESLLQAWSPEFEELLNSDLQFPPTQVDLDIDQYVRVMCAVLDIPTYGTLVESLHVMFTLYCEFRANQHFQHA
jgi:intraflagellar transport protein 46